MSHAAESPLLWTPNLPESTQTTDFLFIASDYKPRPGGIATYLDTLARGLITIGKTVLVLAVVPREQQESIAFLETYEHWVRPFPVSYDRRPASRLGSRCVSALEMARCLWPAARHVLDRTALFRGSAGAATALRESLRKTRPGVVVLGNVDLKVYSLVRALLDERVPYGIIAHDSEVYRFAEKKNDLVRRGMMLKGARWIAANSRHTRELVRQWGIPGEKLMIVHPPIAEGALTASPAGKARADGGPFTMISVCRVVQPKGLDIVLRALLLLKQRGLWCRYIVAGDGPERAPLQKLALELGIADMVRFEGYVSDEKKWALLQSADVFVMPSRVNPKEQHEGFGLAFVEAGAFGIPAVGSNAGGIPDAVIDGKTGILVQPDSPAEVAGAIAWLYEHPERRADMGRVAIERARSQFTPRAVATRFFEEVCKRGLQESGRHRERN